MKKFLSLFAAILFAGSMMADSFTVTFKDNGAGQSDSSAGLTSTDIADYVAEGAEYFSAVAPAGKVYNGQDGYGLKFGNSSNPGSITLTLATAIKPTSIVMNASPWGANEGAGLLQDSVFATTSTGAKGTFGNFTYYYDGATEITTIIVGTSTKRGYVKSITINYESGEEPTMAYYVAGSMTNWGPMAAYKLAANPANEGEYMGEFTFAANDEFKVGYSDGTTIESTNYFPNGMDNNYVITEAGDYTVYFRPDGQGGQDWHYGCIYAAKKEAPQPAEMTAIYDWAGEIGSTIFGGNSNITTGTVKIHENTDNVNGIKFGSSYVYADGKWIAIKPADGGFKAGDVLSLSVVFNNSDLTKYCMVDLRAADGDTRIWMSDSLSTLNGRNAGEPIVQTYTLEADQDSLFLGRYGTTTMFVTLLKVERPAGDDPQPQECDWDAIDFLGDGSAEQTHSNQFKVCKVGEQPNVVNIQTPGFASESGIYVTFPSAVFGTISLPESAYDIQGAGMILHCSAFTEEYTEVTVNCDGNDIVFTVYNAAAAPQPVEHTYTVAGGSDVAFGTTWDPSNEANNMTLVEGLYKWEKTELELAAGTIEFKVCEDHGWNPSYPASNYQLNILEGGIYTITITFNADTKEVNAVATKTGEAVVVPSIAMHGNFLGSWADTENFAVAEGDATASLTLNIAVGNYEFGMRIGGAGNWTANGAAFNRENASHVIVAGQGNLSLAADVAGDYTFTWTYETNTLTITFPTATAISNTAADVKTVKVLQNGMLLIRKGDKTYTIMGQAVK